MMKRLFAVSVVLGLASAVAGAAQAQQTYILLHGNWCGFHKRGGEDGLPPIDALDSACMRHDICYADESTTDCECDVTLMTELRAQNWTDPALSDTARAIYDSIAFLPCRDPTMQRIKAEMVIRDWRYDVSIGRATTADVLRRVRDLFRAREFPWDDAPE